MVSSIEQLLADCKAALAALQIEISEAKAKVTARECQLEKAVEEGKPFSPFEKLLESASANLIGLQKKEEELLKRESQLFLASDKEIQETSPRAEISSLTSKLSNLRLEVSPKAASAYCAGRSGSDEIVSAGVNGIFPTVNLPTIVREATGCAVDDEYLAFPLRIVKRGLLPSMFCNKVAERSNGASRSVDGTLSDLYCQFFKTNFTSVTQKKKFQLKDLNAEIGLATSASELDFAHTTTLKDGLRFGLAVIEFKDTAQSPLEQMGQGFAYGSNIIVSHFRLGLEWSECAIPLAFTNGNLYQFAWVTLLEPSFPVLHISTGVLDASVPSTRKMIAAHLEHMKVFCSEAEERIRRCSTLSPVDPKAPFELDMDKYHRKSLENVFLRWKEKVEESLGYLWQIYERLVGVAEAVLPLACANLKPVTATTEKVIIFPKLDKDYAMGVPSDRKLYQNYLLKLRKAIKDIHQVGVIHVDLYPSNILWRLYENQIVIRIIDWDAATLQGDSFTETMELRLSDKDNSAYYWKLKGEAEPKCDYWFLFILSNLTDEERESMHGDEPATVNIVYKLSVKRQRDANENLDKTFEQWYSSEFS